MTCGLSGRPPARSTSSRADRPVRRRARGSRPALLLWANVLLSLMQVQPSGWTFALFVPAAVLLALSAFTGPEAVDRPASEPRNEFRPDLRAGCHHPGCRSK
jgi:hypothetical protein